MARARKLANESLETILKLSEKVNPLVWIHAPILIHVRAEPGNIAECPCCGSLKARIVETRPDVDLLVNTVRGTRKLREEVSDKVKYDSLCESARKIYLPLRCYPEQLPMVLDQEHTIVGVFGGIRSGKTTVMSEWLRRNIWLHGGPGAQFWWVAPTMKKTRIGVRKLVLGERTDRYVEPLIPPEMVLYYPPNEAAQNQVIKLVDGSEIHLKYASRDGDNLKGDPAICIAVDEASSIDHRDNWAILLGRLIDAGGRLLFATTPKRNHWLREEVWDIGKPYDTATPDDDIVAVSLSSSNNPWVSQEDIDSIRAALKDPKLIAQEIDGEFVSEGDLMWEHYDPQRHLTSVTDISELGFVNITAQAARRLFRNSNANFDFIGGMDFNWSPMSLIFMQIGCRPDADSANPDNWVIFVKDELVRQVGSIHEFGDILANKFGSYRGLRANAFAGMPIICDATGDQRKSFVVTRLNDNSATLAGEMRKMGFDCRPCQKDFKTGNAGNPLRRDTASALQKLLYDKLPDGSPRFFVQAKMAPLVIKALESQERDPSGWRPKKISNTASDKLSGPMDAVLYPMWSLYGALSARPPTVEILW